MNENLSDKTVISIILSTVLIIFIVIFALNNNINQQSQDIQWNNSSSNDIYNEY